MSNHNNSTPEISPRKGLFSWPIIHLVANSRIVSTSFWRDNYVMELDPSEKLLFLYFLTNPNTTLAGVYEINLRTVAFETGFDVDMVKKILDRFCNDGKMWYRDGWLVLKNFIKHQRLNPSIKKGIENAIGELPEWLQTEIKTIQVEGQLKLSLTEVNSQSDDSLGTVTPQLKLSKAKLSKAKLTETNAAKPRGFDKSNVGDKKSYAKAVRADEALATKELEARTRPKIGVGTKSGYEIARAAADKIKHKGVVTA